MTTILIMLVMLLILYSSAAFGHRVPGRTEADEAGFRQREVKKRPQSWTAYARLAAAYLEDARVTHHRADLVRAREAIERSLRLQPSLDGYKTAAAVASFGHRFFDALRWAEKAHRAAPDDAEATALLVEANLALGRLEEAEALLPVKGDDWAARFYTAGLKGRLFRERGNHREAAAAFGGAADIARARSHAALARWADLQRAESLIDSDQLADAEAAWRCAHSSEPRGADVLAVRARLLESRNQPSQALAIYEELLETRATPDLHFHAYRMARRLGRSASAQLHFEAAERGYAAPRSHGEVYSLEGLARLYYEARTHRPRARSIAQQNLRVKRDRSARAVAACLGPTSR